MFKETATKLNFVKYLISITVIFSVACNAVGLIAGGGVSNVKDVESAVIRIVGHGTYLTMEDGVTVNGSLSGSGFIIDATGIAITNNHVVTGASYLDVYIQGDDTPHSARVLGVSECSDLAVIQIEGGKFKHLDWHEGDADVGLDVYTAGFPLGNPEYTLTRGIVSKSKASGDTPWASAEHVIEHDATINPGNSGGPLVDDRGRVVGVNFASISSTNQYFAIAADEVLRIYDRLKNGENVDSIGISGVALTSKLEDTFGVYVQAVNAGSPADQVGVEAGDIIISLADLMVATNPNLGDYCKVLRSHKPTDVMNITVLRFVNDGAVLMEGQLNGKELEVTKTIGMDNGSYDTNLIQNPSNEEGIKNGEIPGWTVISGTGWTLGNDVSAYDGSYYFDASTAGVSQADLCQAVDVSGYRSAIDAGKQEFELQVAVRSYPAQFFVPADSSLVYVLYFDENNDELDAVSTDEYFSTSGWSLKSFSLDAPPKTRKLLLCLRSTLYGGYDSDGYFDAVSLTAKKP